MPLYDCGERECDECQRAFGPNRERAIKNFEAREVFYAELERMNTQSRDRRLSAAPPSENFY